MGAVAALAAAIAMRAIYSAVKFARMDLTDDLGYQLKASESKVCTQCHGREDREGFYELHEEHVDEEGYDCSRCHTFSRPERDLR